MNEVCLTSLKDLKEFYKRKNIKNYNKGFLFKSLNRKYIANSIDRPLTNSSFNRILKKIQKELKIPYNLGSHSLRKTWGKYYYENYRDVGSVMKILNHSSEKMSLRYIGLDKEKLKNIYKNFKI